MTEDDDPIGSVIDLVSRRPVKTPEELRGIKLEIGSDVEIAGRVGADLRQRYGDIVFCEGQLWRYNGTHWQAIPAEEQALAVHRYDGARYETAKGDPANVRLNAGRVASILKSMMYRLTRHGFFDTPAIGINCRAGFIEFDRNGEPSIREHQIDDRCRHVLPGRWQPDGQPPQEGSLLARLLEGCFRGDSDAHAKVELVGEVMGAAALGIGTRLKSPKAIILYGPTAENGKGQIILLCRAVLPPNATSSVRLSKFHDDTHICHLAGKLLNASDEMALGGAIASDIFKQVVTGDPIDVRDVYESAFELRPIAQHVIATNNLPAFRGGMDRGVRRRLLLLMFNRVVPRSEQIEGIAGRVASEEPDLLLEMAVRGAQRLIANGGFREPASSGQALSEWIFSSDPILAWLESDAVSFTEHNFIPKIYTGDAHDRFVRWASDQGFKNLPQANGFTQRVVAASKGITKSRDRKGPYFMGLACIGPGTKDNENWSRS